MEAAFQTAEEEARKLSESLKESQDSKLFRNESVQTACLTLCLMLLNRRCYPMHRPTNAPTNRPTPSTCRTRQHLFKKRTRTATTTTSATIPTTVTTINKRKGPRQWERLPKKGHSSKQTIKKRTTYRKNRHKHKHIQNTDTSNNATHDIIIDHDNTDLHVTIHTDNTMNNGNA